MTPPSPVTLPDEPAVAVGARRRQTRALVATGVAVVAIGTVGALLTEGGTTLHLLGGYLIRGPFAVDLTPWVVLPVVVAAATVSVGHLVTARLPWRMLLAASWVAGIAWSVALALVRYGPTTPEGSPSLGAPLEVRYEYLHDIPRVHGLRSLLAEYVENIGPYADEPWTTHVAGHPPGPLALFAGMDAIGLGGSTWAGWVCILAGAATIPAVLVAVRALHHEQSARWLAPFLVLAPWSLWVATSADTVWMATSAWSLALLTLTTIAGVRGRLAALGAGLGFGLSIFGSYGVAPLALVAFVVLIRVGRLRDTVRDTIRDTSWVAVGVLAPVLAAGSAGFWWWEGLLQTSRRVAAGPGSMDRPLLYFLFANLAVAALALGPAVVAGFASGRPLARVRDLPLVWATSAALLLANFTGLAKGEVERIWLPYYPWITVVVLLLGPARSRRWLAAQAALALALQVFIRTEW